MAAKRVTLFLSTGRCGTQWAAEHLGALYPDARVTHEPIGPRYRPRESFRVAGAPPPPDVERHLDEIEALPATVDYVETGWPLFASIPLFESRFGDRLRIVHLTRHPVRTALSHMVHQCYWGSPRHDDYTRVAALGPGSPGVFQTGYSERWDAMTPFEKCLYWCTEVHLYARELDAEGSIPMLRVRAEDVLAGDEAALQSLVDFLGLPYRDDLTARTSDRVDAWHHRTRLDLDWHGVFDHPAALDVVEWLGYGFEELDDAGLRDRYAGSPGA